MKIVCTSELFRYPHGSESQWLVSPRALITFTGTCGFNLNETVDDFSIYLFSCTVNVHLLQ